MANTVSSFYQTLVAGATEASQVLVGTCAAVEAIYKDYDPSVSADIGQTINVPIPASQVSNVYDAGVGSLSLYDVSAATKPIVMNQHPTASFVVRDFEQYNTPEKLRNVFIDGALKAVKMKINSVVTALMNSTNFNVNTAISTTGHIVSVSQFLNGKTALGDQLVDVDDPESMSLLLPSSPYNAMCDSSTTAGQAWVQAQIAGQRTAEEVRSTGKFPTSFGCTIRRDQQMTITGTAPNRTFTGWYGHKYAIAMVTRKLPAPDPDVVHYTYVNFAGIPLLVSLGYNQIYKGWVISIEGGFGVAVIRPEMGQIYTIAE